MYTENATDDFIPVSSIHFITFLLRLSVIHQLHLLQKVWFTTYVNVMSAIFDTGLHNLLSIKPYDKEREVDFNM